MKHQITIGRSFTNDFVIEDVSVSRKHALLVFQNGDWILTDLQSTNGTFVNGKRITSASINPDDRISFGSVKISAKDLLKAISVFPEKDNFIPEKIVSVGRNPENDWQIKNSLISTFHAELLISKDGKVKIIDKNSTNGTFVNKVKVTEKILAPEDVVLLAGEVPLNWKKVLEKQKIREKLIETPARTIPIGVWIVLFLVGIAGVWFGKTFFFSYSYQSQAPTKEGDTTSGVTPAPLPSSPQPVPPPPQKVIVYSSDECIPSSFKGKAPAIKLPENISFDAQFYCDNKSQYKELMEAARKADYQSPEVRNLSVCWASAYPGSFNIGQVSVIYDSLRKYWRYVNDPRGEEYFAKASETIHKLKFKGDCDDFAIVLYAMLSAIGGYPRMNFAYNPEGGHAFVEIYIGERNSKQVKKIYEFLFNKYPIEKIHFRPYQDQIWINLDWFADYPAGSYFSYTACYTIDPLNRICFKDRKNRR